MNTYQVTENVWCFKWASYFSCSYLINDENGIVLIDAGMQISGCDIIKFIDKNFNKPVTAIFLTHWHNDHAAGCNEIQRHYNCIVYSGINEIDYIRHNKRKPIVTRLMPNIGPAVLLHGLIDGCLHPPVEIISTVSSNNLHFGIRSIDTPGHTLGHTSYYHERLRILFCGDSMAVVGNKLAYMSRFVTKDIKTAMHSMIIQADFTPSIICPGHRNFISVQFNEWELFRKHVQKSNWPLFGRLQ